MGALTIRNLSEALVASIKRRAADHGLSMEEEIRRLLHNTYADDRQARGRAWARRQLERLQRGELPKSTGNSADLIRSMREERTEQIAQTSRMRRAPHR